MLATRQFSRNIYIQNWLLFAIVAILLIALLSIAFQNFSRPSDQPAWAQPAFTACEKEVLTNLRVEKKDFTSLANVETLCFNNLRHESLSKYPPAKPGALRLGAPQRGPIPNL